MQERKINNPMQCFKASDSSSNSSRRARAAEEIPISEEDIPAAMDAVKKITKKIMLLRKSTWKLFSSGSAAHADFRSPLGETRHPSQKGNFHLCQVKIPTSEKDFVPGKNFNYGATLMVVTESWSKECSGCNPLSSPQPPFLNFIYLDSFNLVIGWIRTFNTFFQTIFP